MAEDIGVKVTLLPQIESDKFQAAVDAAAKKNKVTINEVAISSDAMGKLTESIRKAVEKSNVDIKSIKVRKIDSKVAMASLKKDLESLFASLQVDGLKLSFKDGEIAAQFKGVKEAAEAAAKQTGSIKSELDVASKKAGALGREYSSMLSKIGKIDSSLGAGIEKQLTEKYSAATKAVDEYVKKLKEGKDATAELAAVESTSAEFNSFVQQYDVRAKAVKDYTKQIADLEKYSSRLGEKFGTGDAGVQNLNAQIATLKTRLDEFGSSATADVGQFRAEMDRSIASARGLGDQIKNDTVVMSNNLKPVISLLQQIQSFRKNNPRVNNSEYAGQIDDIASELTGMKDSGSYNPARLKELSSSFADIGLKAKEAGYAGRGFLDALKGMGAVVAQSMLLRQAFMYIRQAARDALNAVVEVDSAMTQLRIVTGATDAEMSTFFNSAAASAKELGASVSGVLDSLQVFARLGYGLKDALDLSEAATVLSNVAATSIDEATTGLTSIVKGFGIEASDVMSVADILTDVGQKLPVSAAELSQALMRGGSSLHAANNTLEEAVALIAAGNASVGLCADVKNGYIGQTPEVDKTEVRLCGCARKETVETVTPVMVTWRVSPFTER